MSEQTQAEKFGAEFGNDGQCFETGDGRGFAEVLGLYCVTLEWIDGDNTRDTVRCVFPDGSIITQAGAGWDYGHADCFCWEGNGHSGCQHDQELN